MGVRSHNDSGTEAASLLISHSKAPTKFIYTFTVLNHSFNKTSQFLKTLHNLLSFPFTSSFTM